MKKALLFSTIMACVLNAQAQDDCNNPLPITAGTYGITVVDGPFAPDPICAPSFGPATHAEYYIYTAPQDYSLTVSTDLLANIGRDTRFHVYIGSCGSFTCVSGDDDSGSGLLSVATFQVTQGMSYVIVFDDHWEDIGFEFQLTESPPVQNQLTFTPSPISLSGSPMCIVDMDGDNLDDVVAVSSTNVNIHYQQLGGGFLSTNISTTPADHPASWSMAAGDLDGNGFTDLLYGGGGGATIMMANSTGTAFTEISPNQYIFSQRTN